MSLPFRRACAGCHGPTGAGDGRYPSLPGAAGFSAYQSIVRRGGFHMPRYDNDFIDDETLRNDFERLVVLRTSDSATPVAEAAEWRWDSDRLESAFDSGMDAWETPDASGVACADCHAPDALDLAVIGYEDDAILRRAAAHVGPSEAADIVELVHAQRRLFNIGEACDPKWRVLQPGGEPLPGDTREERDQSFANMVSDRGYILAAGAVVTLEDARAALAETASVDLRRLPIGIELPRWSEDRFNGAAHRSIDDYL
ncbi:MAG: cytochrome c, partial [Myxococcota bacterium]